MRGVRLLVAVGVVAELGDLHRFDHPRKLMAYLGLVPSEHSFGGKRYQRMNNKGKHYNLIITAIAREMPAYIWAFAKEVVLTPVNPKLRLSRVPA